MQFRISQSDSLMVLKRDILAASSYVPMLQLSKTQCERVLFSMRTGGAVVQAAFHKEAGVFDFAEHGCFLVGRCLVFQTAFRAAFDAV